ncbi:cation:proton antiporter [Legionella genomosp. 1]|uniref:cation:proton antiporter domain-containing protein n=1 Tax=Legionella genomosp. 1 TaxID=1093625 RepID=UPI0010560C82|nr:cation:proton antiporter [Legionella genomosp. 1]
MILTAFAAIFCLALASAVKLWADKWYISYPMFMTLSGFLSSEALVEQGVDTGLRYYHVDWLISAFLIPTVIFNTTLSFDEHSLYEDKSYFFYLIVGVYSFSILIGTLLLYFAMNHPSGFPWLAALLTSCILAATNTRAISDLLKNSGISLRLLSLLKGESLISSVLSLSIVSFLLNRLTPQTQPNDQIWLIQLLITFIVPLFTGIGLGLLAKRLLSKSMDAVAAILFLTSCVYGLYFINSTLFSTSGSIAVFVFGLFTKESVQTNLSIKHYWQANSFLATLLMFFILGMTVTIDMFPERWLAMIIGIAAILIGRYLSLTAGFSLISKLTTQKVITFKEQLLLSISGTRGALAIALAFMLPETFDYWWTIQSIVFGVVLFSIFVQAPLAAYWQKTGLKNLFKGNKHENQ